MNISEIIRFLILRTVGNFLVLFALFGVFATFGPAIFYEIAYRIGQVNGIRYTIADTKQNVIPTPTPDTFEPVSSGFADLLGGSKEHILIPKDTFFDILIPKIGANAKVFPNVDPSNEKEYVATLQKGVAHAKGTVFPGMNGIMYLFAHSTDNWWNVGRYNAVFYLLKDMRIGDDVVMFFQDKRYNYKVTDSKIVDPDAVDYLTKSQSISKQLLILQTCWPPGTTWKRLVVFAEPLK